MLSASTASGTILSDGKCGKPGGDDGEQFKGIGARGTATLAVVAPGISEALIATAAGLAAAIPAVIFYNYFLNRSKTMVQEMENFSAGFLNIVERYLVRK